MAIYLLNPLSDDEQLELQHHLTIIKTSVIATIRALAHIHQKRLYRGDGGRSWAEFCQSELNFSPRYGHYLVSAFAVLETIEGYNEVADDPLPLPVNEGQARALSALPKDVIVATWQATVKQHGTGASRKTITEVYQALKQAGASEATAETLGKLANTQTGATIANELLSTGYLQTGDIDEVIPLEQLRPDDVTRYMNDLRRENIMQRVANEGGVSVTIYPADSERTAKALMQWLNPKQAYELSIILDEYPKTAKITG